MASLFRRLNGFYYVVTTVNGRRSWRSTGCRNKPAALKSLTSNQGSTPGRPATEEPTLKLSQFQAQVLAYAKTNVAPSTVVLYGYAFRDLLRLIGDHPIKDYTPQMVEQFKVKRLEEVSDVKVNIDFRTLRAAFSLAVRWNLIPDNPFKKCKQLRIPERRPVYLTLDEYQTLVSVIDKEWFRDIVRFAVTTMMRLGEIVNLKWDSVDLDRSLLHVENSADFRTKTRKRRILPLDKWTIELLRRKERISELVFTFPDSKRLQVGYVSSRFKKYVRKAAIRPDIHFHSLRHTGATWLVQNAVPIYTVQQILGHSSIQMTQVYSHLEAENLIQSLNKISQTLDKIKMADGTRNDVGTPGLD
ncbi:MAG: tyrosine-type recombinase/integrase [Bacteroidota bacterium]|jgi:integrase